MTTLTNKHCACIAEYSQCLPRHDHCMAFPLGTYEPHSHYLTVHKNEEITS